MACPEAGTDLDSPANGTSWAKPNRSGPNPVFHQHLLRLHYAHYPYEPIDPFPAARQSYGMNAVEFTTELSGAAVLQIPSVAAAQLPKAGKARVIVLTDEDTDDAEWRAAAYEQFMRDDAPEDSICDSCC